MSKYHKAEDIRQRLLELCDNVDYMDAGQRVIALLNIHKCMDAIAGLPIIEVSEDCISRADALNEFKKDYDDVFDLMVAIEELPSVVPSRAEGEWKNTVGGIYMCSNCKSSFTNIPKDGYWKPMWNFCPNCGAKMKE